ncbi:hypothetical protein VTK73DRAFT_317 [Phialemonium thermophilum]|uniref:Uncharacterized protein n=1 Tax=Phialemonium thermophilum TaxID=223376 RepID=A0ABR3VVW3_9PEZI
MDCCFSVTWTVADRDAENSLASRRPCLRSRHPSSNRSSRSRPSPAASGLARPVRRRSRARIRRRKTRWGQSPPRAPRRKALRTRATRAPRRTTSLELKASAGHHRNRYVAKRGRLSSKRRKTRRRASPPQRGRERPGGWWSRRTRRKTNLGRMHPLWRPSYGRERGRRRRSPRKERPRGTGRQRAQKQPA